MPTIDFGPRTLATLKDPPAGADGAVQWVEQFDRSTPGLYLRASSTGARTWMFMGRVMRDGRRKLARFKLGAAWTKDNQAGMPLSAARTAAAAMKADLKAGIDPAQREREQEQARAEASANTFEAAVQTFLAQYPKREKLRPSTERQYRDFLQGDDFAVLDNKPLATISKSDITGILDTIQERGATVRANRALASAKKMFRWYVGRGQLAVDPTNGMTPPVAEEPRDRHLFGGRDKPSEIALAWRAFERCGRYAPFLKLLVLTGARLNEVARMQGGELADIGEDAYWVIPGDRAKNHREHHMPLGAMAAEIVRTVPRVEKCPYLFTTNGRTPISGFSKLKKQVDKAVAEIKAAEPERYKGQLEEPFTFHDLRRTFKTGLASLRVDKEIRDALLNHARQGIDAHYDHSELDAEKRAAVEVWERHIAACLNPPDKSNVLPLRAAR